MLDSPIIIFSIIAASLIPIKAYSFSNRKECNLEVSGKLKDEVTGEALSGATIYIKSLKQGAITDINGVFIFRGLCAGSYVFEVKYLGYKTQEYPVLLKSSQQKVLLTIHPEKMYLKGVSIEAEKPQHTIQRTEQLDEASIAQSLGKSLGESIKNLPGVNSLQSGPGISKPVIQGLHSNRVLILNNGVRQEGQQWGSEHAPEIDPFIASKITVIKGAAAVRYGSDAIGGLIIVEPPDIHRTKKLGGEINTGMMTNGRMGVASGMLEGGINKIDGLGWRVQSTYKIAGDSRAPDYYLTNTGVRELNFSAGIGYEKDESGIELFFSHFDTELGILRSAHNGNSTDFNEAIVRDEPLIIEPFSYDIEHPKQDVGHDLLKVSGFTPVGDFGKASFQYGWQYNSRKEFDRRLGDLYDVPALDLTLKTHTLDVMLDHRPIKDFIGAVGISGLYQNNRWDPETGRDPIIPWFNQYNIGVFLIERLVKDRWELETGIRYDLKYLDAKIFNRDDELINQDYYFNSFSFTVGGQYNLSPSVTVNTNLGTAWRPPHVSELFSNGVHHGTASYEMGLLIDDTTDDIYENLDEIPVPTETSYKWIMGTDIQRPKWTLSASAYYNRINDFIFLEPQVGDVIISIRGAYPLYRFKQTDARLIGADGTFTYALNDHFTYVTKASIVRARNILIDDGIIWMPPDQVENSIRYEWEPKGKIDDLHLSLGTLKVWEQTRVPEESDFADPPEGYFLVNFHLGFDLPVQDNKLSVYFNIDNLLNTSYRNYMNRMRYFADEVGRNFTLRLKYSFHNH